MLQNEVVVYSPPQYTLLIIEGIVSDSAKPFLQLSVAQGANIVLGLLYGQRVVGKFRISNKDNVIAESEQTVAITVITQTPQKAVYYVTEKVQQDSIIQLQVKQLQDQVALLTQKLEALEARAVAEGSSGNNNNQFSFSGYVLSSSPITKKASEVLAKHVQGIHFLSSLTAPVSDVLLIFVFSTGRLENFVPDDVIETIKTLNSKPYILAVKEMANPAFAKFEDKAFKSVPVFNIYMTPAHTLLQCEANTKAIQQLTDMIPKSAKKSSWGFW